MSSRTKAELFDLTRWIVPAARIKDLVPANKACGGHDGLAVRGAGSWLLAGVMHPMHAWVEAVVLEMNSRRVCVVLLLKGPCSG